MRNRVIRILNNWKYVLASTNTNSFSASSTLYGRQVAEGETQEWPSSECDNRHPVSEMAKPKGLHQFTSTMWSHLLTVGFEHNYDE